MQWEVALTDASKVQAEGARQLVNVNGRHLALIRHQSQLLAIDATCYHMGGPLLLGDIEDIAGVGPCLTCPWHHYQICLTSGERVYHDLQHQVKTMPRRQRVHSAMEWNNQVLIQLNADVAQYESDRYAFKEPPPAQRSSTSANEAPMKSGEVLKRARAGAGADGHMPRRLQSAQQGQLGRQASHGRKAHSQLLSPETFTSFCVESVTQVAHNVVDIQLQSSSLLWSSALGGVGRHVMVTITGNEDDDRPYTPVVRFNWQDRSESCSLLVKTYAGPGRLSSLIAAQQPSTTLLMRGPFNGVSSLFLAGVRCIGMIAAGTGITPMLQIVHSLLAKSKRGTIAELPQLNLLFANRREEDIICRDELDRLQSETDQRFNVTHILSQPNEKWTGLRGRITFDILSKQWEKMPEKNNSSRLLVCGPSSFGQSVYDALPDVWPSSHMYVFQE